MSKILIYILLVIFCLITAWLFFADSEGLVVKMHVKGEGKDFRNVYYIKKDELKIVGENSTILFSKNRISFLNRTNKLFWEGSIAEFNQYLVKDRLQADTNYSSKSDLFYHNLPAKNKSFFDQITQNISGQKEKFLIEPEIFTTPDYRSIAGYVSRKYEIKQGDELVEEIWIAENLKSYVNYDLNLNLYRDFMHSFLQHRESKLYYHLESFMEIVENGFPMKITMYDKGKPTVTTVETLYRKHLDDSVFKIPENYKSAPLEEVIS